MRGGRATGVSTVTTKFSTLWGLKKKKGSQLAAGSLTNKQIDSYNWGSHQFEVYNDILTERLQGRLPMTGKPFVAVAEGQRIYVGAFWTLLSSVSSPGIPLIVSTWTPGTENDFYKIEELGSRTDKIDDERIYKALKKAVII